MKLAGVDFPIGNPTIVILVLLLGGMNLICLGIMGQYVGRIYEEVKRRPRYIVESAVGFSDRYPVQSRRPRPGAPTAGEQVAMTTDVGYTHEDHVFRNEDPYARAKYDITTRWIAGAARGGTLFHIGCGSGVFNTTALELGFVVRAFEPDDDAAVLAQRAAPPGLRIERTALGGDRRAKGVADVIVMHDVLEHIDDDRAAVDDLCAAC